MIVSNLVLKFFVPQGQSTEDANSFGKGQAKGLWVKYYAPLFSLDCLLSTSPCSIFAGDTHLGEYCLPLSHHPSYHWGRGKGDSCAASVLQLHLTWVSNTTTNLQTFRIPVFQSSIFFGPLIQGIRNSSLHFCLKFSKCFTRHRIKELKNKSSLPTPRATWM